MDNQIKITMSEVRSAAANMRSLNSSMDNTLVGITNMMNELGSVWSSEGAEAISAHYKSFANRFVVESETIEEYCKFLDYTADTYDSVESVITGNANNFE